LFSSLLANDFIDAYYRLDLDRAASYQAAGATVSDPGTGGDWRLGARWSAAVGTRYLPHGCEDQPPRRRRASWCVPYDVRAMRSEDMGLVRRVIGVVVGGDGFVVADGEVPGVVLERPFPDLLAATAM
jgi:hypothetical protein